MDRIIRTATLADLDAVAAVEAACFPAAEAATRAEFADRLAHYGGHFWLMFDGGTLIAFVDGMVTDLRNDSVLVGSPVTQTSTVPA